MGIQNQLNCYLSIFARTDSRRTPLDIARNQQAIDFLQTQPQRHGNQSVIEYLQTQLVYARQAQDMTAMTTVNENGWLPLQYALKLKDNVPLGSVKLLLPIVIISH